MGILPCSRAGTGTLQGERRRKVATTPGGGANRPQLTGPGLAGPGLYNPDGTCAGPIMARAA